MYICDNAYTREQIVQMEQLILSKLNFRLTVPTQRSYLKRFCKAAQVLPPSPAPAPAPAPERVQAKPFFSLSFILVGFSVHSDAGGGGGRGTRGT